MREVRSRTLQLNTFSRLRLWAGESSSSKITVSTSARRQWSENSSALPLPIKVVAQGETNFCTPSPTTWPPAVVASSVSSSNESRGSAPFRVLSSTPTRKTRSVLRVLISMSDFNAARRRSLFLFLFFYMKGYHLFGRRKSGFLAARFDKLVETISLTL